MFVKKLDQRLQESLEKEGIEIATEFQKKCISQMKSGGDLVAIADEGKGKTTSYAVMLINKLKHAVADVPRAMVICANKDNVLALQEKCETLANYTDLRFHVGFEGANIQNQKDTIYFGTDVVIGTPRRITELMSIEGINFSEIKTLVIDDGELVLKDTALSQLNRISESLPNSQKVIFTTKNTTNRERYSDKFMRNPKLIS